MINDRIPTGRVGFPVILAIAVPWHRCTGRNMVGNHVDWVSGIVRPPHRLPRRQLLRTASFLTLAVCLLSTPVTYRGGAAAPHPHMFLQLWLDAAHGDFRHHAGASDPHMTMPLADMDHHVPVAGVEHADHPTMSAFIVSDYGQPSLALPAAAGPSGPEGLHHFDADVGTSATLRTLSPEPPPPRPSEA